MADACNVNNVMGKLDALANIKGAEVEGGFNAFDNSEQAEAFDRSVTADRVQLAESKPDGVWDWLKQATGDPLKGAGYLYTANRNWSGRISEEFIQPMQDFLEQHYKDYADDLDAGKADYFDQIDDVLDSLPTEGLNEAQLRDVDRYKAIYRNGGVFYGSSDKLAIVSNIVSNTIQSSPTVLLGNPLELSYKLPALYPKQVIPAIQKAFAEGITKRHPEIEAKGGYGSSIGAEQNVLGKRNKFEGIIGLTDIPMKNITYWAGELAEEGGGTKALQQVMFVPRFADVPEIYHNDLGRATVGLLSYTINTYKLIGQLSKNALKGDAEAARGLLTMYVIAGAIGGVGSESGDPISSTIASGMPQPIEDAIKMAFPETEEWFDSNKGSLSKLIKPANLNKVGIPFEMLKRQMGKVIGAGSDSIESLGEGDLAAAAVNLGDAALSLLPFGKGQWVNDMQFQKAKNMAVDVFKGDLDLEDVPSEAQEKFLPFLGD